MQTVYRETNSNKKSVLTSVQSNELESLLIDCRRSIPNLNESLIRKAFLWCINTHKNQIRKSGEDYYQHPLSVAKIIANEMPIDEISVVSALLHELPRHNQPYSLSDVKKDFGNTIADIIEGIQKIHHVETRNLENLENYRRLLLALFKDVRIILIKLADRLHNMRTLDYLDIEIQKKIAEETMEIYAPFAHRFGLGNIKWELEDLSFKHLNHDCYNQIREEIQLTRKEREDYLQEFILPIKNAIDNDPLIKSHDVTYEIKGRPKHIYSIYNKTILRDKPISELYDLFAVRIILDSDYQNFCFVVFGLISELYAQVPNTFKNYISYSKKNGYQSLHAAFFGKDKRPVEVQIRTRTMHDIAERGVAAHFNYKPGYITAQSVMNDNNIEEWLDQVKMIFETLSDEASPEKLIENVRRTLLFDEIYVFTPKYEFRTFPKDATILDFAYSIHSNLGNHCISAKVNGRIVPLDYKLQMGDAVEIVTSTNQSPTKEWLEFVITHKARVGIQRYLKEEYKNQASLGKEVWSKELKTQKLKINQANFAKILTSLHCKSEDEFYTALHNGFIDFEQIWEVYSEITKSVSKDTTEQSQIKNAKKIAINKYHIKLATCCFPIQLDKITGELISSKDLIIHNRKCNKITSIENPDNKALLRVYWDYFDINTYLTKIIIKGELSANITNDITNLMLSLKGIKIQGFKFDSSDNEFTGNVTFSFEKIELYDELVKRIYEINGIKSIERFQNI